MIEEGEIMNVGVAVFDAVLDVRAGGGTAGPTAVVQPAHRSLSALEELGERIAELAAQISAATYELLVMLRDFDERGGWNSGFRSCAHWLVWRVGLDAGAAREKMRVARALGALPVLSESLRRGEVSYSKVRALTRIATPANERDLLNFARAGTAAHVEKLVRGMRRVDLSVEDGDKRSHEARYLRAYTDEDGMVVVKGRLEPEAGAALLRALDAGVEELYGPRRIKAPGEAREVADETADEIPMEQRRADALGLVAESALTAGLDPGSRGDRYQVVVHVDAAALRADGEEGTACLEDCGNVSAETCRRLACDSAMVVMRHAADGRVLDVGRRTRAISPGLRRALVHRDGGCRFPGCGRKLCDAHHVEHWVDGGKTSLANTLLLCRRHHRAVHEEGFSMELTPNGEARFHRPDGRPLPEAPVLPALPERPVATLVSRLAGHGVAVDSGGTLPSWSGGRVDYGWAIDWLRWVARRPAPAARELLESPLSAPPPAVQGRNASG